MNKPINNYSHILECDEERRVLTIYRLYENGRKSLFTSVDFPDKKFPEDEQGFRKFAQVLGENLLIDSPAARKILSL